ncbi:hypothetical protein Kpol_359p13 [Vanderwaltozyma polyspora DSM 70294]|uniref:TLC domain-containing protein n=1 Tax=Vanderwaltozyma polyspora (strain ATCC 22028 / DSM 70294 / BCRC 21397 / CBS 2163 / NBRC 10782 / NRRL Y-8283 / UCD 57-17) TaxID=436907 RepID=A7TSB5_VANPO|nr:uncharacterized protein Kpol_359p13 [Vanderwaltozyma polyspora DSM 70294]EDO14852.1 hypothetical protein Kpol_359p13 [Vanderwaltozyma polyspora DSM 70294]
MLDYITNALVTWPAPGFFESKLLPFLHEKNIIRSESIAENLHSVVYVAFFYHAWFLFGKYVMFPPFAGHVTDKRKRRNLINQSAVHLVSFVQAIVILYLSIRLMLDEENYISVYQDSVSRVFTETRGTQIICIYAIGYFTWDIYISTFYSTLPFVLHGVISTVVYTIGLKPYIQYYAPVFLIFELSNPGLNIRWFLMKYAPSYKKFLTINNFFLMITFFLCRIVWGWYQIIKLCWDYYQIYDMEGFKPFDTFIIVFGNFILDILNLVWFSKMVSVAIAVLRKPKKE